MANTEMFTQLPTVSAALPTDIICAVQNNISVQETLAQVSATFLSQTILSYPGDPNGNLAGTTYQLCWDTVNQIMYVCTTSGSASGAVWTQASITGIVQPVQGGTGVSNPTDNGVAVAQGAASFQFLTLTDGQVLIGSTGNSPVPATLTAGSNIAISNAAGNITISSTGPAGFAFQTVVGTSQAMSNNVGYITSNVALTTFTLPVSSSVGDLVNVTGKGSGGWTITYGSGQSIQVGATVSTTTSGSVSSTNAFDAITLVCTAASTSWSVFGAPQGNLTIL